jgi:hypothetical protein
MAKPLAAVLAFIVLRTWRFQMQYTRTKTVTLIETYATCDRCGREMVLNNQDCEYQERVAIRFRAGYGSIFEDGSLVESDICQHCLQDVFGKYLRITRDDPFDPRHKLIEEPVGVYQESQLQRIHTAEDILRNFQEVLKAER